jgi:predicted RNA-binding Zn ribbon-like protein
VPSQIRQPVPEDLELLGSFVNTLEKMLDGRPDEEALDSPEALAQWMEAHGIPAGDDLDEADLRRTIEFREALRTLLRANNDSILDADAVGRLRAAADVGLIRIEVDSTGRAVAGPAHAGLGALFARLLAAVADSQAAGTWERMKACAADDCEWAFYDSSKNRSRTWCSMGVCGNRAKTRAYRARRRRAT